MLKKSNGSTLLDRIQRKTPLLLGINTLYIVIIGIILDRAFFTLWSVDAQVVICFILPGVFMAGWSVVYIILLLVNYLRRISTDYVVWTTGGLIMLWTYVTEKILFRAVENCGGWNSFLSF